VLPDDSTGRVLSTRHPDSYREVGQKSVTVQGGGACPDEAERSRGRIFCTRLRAKNVTNNLPLLSVLGEAVILILKVRYISPVRVFLCIFQSGYYLKSHLGQLHYLLIYY
jgi:hypothetical protein